MENSRDPRAWAAAQAIDKIVALWLEKMNLPITNEVGRDLFQNVLADVIEEAYARNCMHLRQKPKHGSMCPDCGHVFRTLAAKSLITQE